MDVLIQVKEEWQPHTYSSFYSRLLPPQVISSFRWHTVYHLHQALPIQSHVCLCNVGEERRLEASNQCCKYDLHYTGNIFFFYSDVIHVTGYAIVISFAGVLHIGSRLCPTSMCKNYLHQGGMYWWITYHGPALTVIKLMYTSPLHRLLPNAN